jgi:hypothetical protein
MLCIKKIQITGLFNTDVPASSLKFLVALFLKTLEMKDNMSTRILMHVYIYIHCGRPEGAVLR